MTKFTCALLALTLILASLACLAEPETVYERETLIAACEDLDAARHIVYTETWEYPIIDGQRGSGRPVADDEGDVYTRPHHFADGVCVDCNAVNTAEPGTFIAASGVVITRGATAAEVLKQVFAAIPESAGLTLADVEAEPADRLLAAVRDDASPEAFAALLADFPAQSVEDTDCRVVTVRYTDGDDWQVVESYAFSAADCALVSLY